MSTSFTEIVRRRFGFLEREYGLTRRESCTNTSELVAYSNSQITLKLRFDYRDLRFYFVREHDTRTGLERTALSTLSESCVSVDSARLQPIARMDETVADVSGDRELEYWASLMQTCARDVILLDQQ